MAGLSGERPAESHFGQLTPVGVSCPKEGLRHIPSFPSRCIRHRIQVTNMKKPLVRKQLTPEEVEQVLLASAQNKTIREIMVLTNRSRGAIWAITTKHSTRLIELRKRNAQEAVSAKFGKVHPPKGEKTETVALAVATHPSPIVKNFNSDAPPTLADCELEIRKGLRTFYVVGNALWAIRHFGLFKPEFKNFEDYCQERWGISKTHANRQIAALEVVAVLEDESAKQLTEWEVRPLTKLPKDQLKGIWEKAKELAHTEKVPLSGKILQSAADIPAVPKPTARKTKNAAAKVRLKAYSAAMRAVGAAESAVKAGDLKAVGAALLLIRTEIERLAP